MISYLISSHLISSHPSHLTSSHLISSYLISSHLISSHLNLSYLILSYLISSYLILSYLILSYLIFCNWSFVFLFLVDLSSIRWFLSPWSSQTYTFNDIIFHRILVLSIGRLVDGKGHLPISFASDDTR